jgi:hypothetical protein
MSSRAAAVTVLTSASVATASGRRQQEAQRLENLDEIFEVEYNVHSLSPEQFKHKLSTDIALPSGFHTHVIDLMLIYRPNLVDSDPEI